MPFQYGCTQDSPNQKGSISECYLSEIMAKKGADHLRGYCTADIFVLLWLKRGKSGGCIKTIKSDNFSIKLYAVTINKNRLIEAILIDSNNI